MRDKLTKKRIKVDYLLLINVLGFELDFLEYQFKKGSRISLRRQAFAFLRTKLKDYELENVYYTCKEHGITSFEDFKKFEIDTAKFNIWED